MCQIKFGLFGPITYHKPGSLTPQIASQLPRTSTIQLVAKIKVSRGKYQERTEGSWEFPTLGIQIKAIKQSVTPNPSSEGEMAFFPGSV